MTPLRTAALLGALTALLLLAGLAAGSEGWSLPPDAMSDLVLWQIRAPRTLGAWLVGALLGLGGALAQGLFRNPLAEPFLLGAAPGATLAVVLVLAASALAGSVLSPVTAGQLARFGLVAAAFAGALAGVTLTLTLARGAVQPTTLLLAGIVVGFLLGALSDLATLAAPEALRGKQAFLLGSTGYLGWPACTLLAAGLLLTLAAAWPTARALDALTLGDETAASLGVGVGGIRLALVATMALATAVAVAQAGMVGFVGLAAPHLARRSVAARHALLVPASAALGGVLLLAADLAARTLIAPQELPVGVLTAVLGGGYLMLLLRQRRRG
ncbi:iron ABC transporter permease [Aquincola sp. S2]|uniref:Iron ABC transporter permease n=1 Tax=Pseudaquabacterium terrae TaxID=2732868 RepID=A0ABX2EP95_9BURK|nr:iron ABC transporter permease [Aquabacterium terrae]NRF70467.1 iron ABC transporter permease [Aquabacterium terrae]